MAATAFSPASVPQMYLNTSHRVNNVVRTTESVNNFYAQSKPLQFGQQTKVVSLNVRIFDVTFINNLTQEIKDVSKTAQETFLNNEPFTPKTYRDAREAHAGLSKNIETLILLSDTNPDLSMIPNEAHDLVRAMKELFVILNKCHKHLSNRFDELDKRGADAPPSKYLRRVTGKERWNLRPSVYEYQV